MGPQAVGAKVFHAGFGNGTVTGHDGKSVKVKFGDGTERSFEAKSGKGAGRLEKRPAAARPVPAAAPKAAPEESAKPKVRAAPKAREPTAAKPKTAASRPETDLRAALGSGVASHKAPGSAKVEGSQGYQGGVKIVKFNNGAEYIHKDFKGLVALGADGRVPMQDKKLFVAKEVLASKISDAIGAGAPAILKDPKSQTGFYEPKIAGKSAMEHFAGRKQGAEKLYSSPEGLRIGLLDSLISSDDRHLGNVMITPDGKPVPIDHNDSWVTGQRISRSRGPFADALSSQIKAGKSPFSAAELDQVEKKIQALKPQFDAMPDGNGARYYQMTMSELTRIRDQVAGK